MHALYKKREGTAWEKASTWYEVDGSSRAFFLSHSIASGSDAKTRLVSLESVIFKPEAFNTKHLQPKHALFQQKYITSVKAARTTKSKSFRITFIAVE
jgi:hypothetical protein